MNYSNTSLQRISDVLNSVRERGVRLWAENGRLHYRAPKGALSQEEIEGLQIAKDQIVALLEKRATDMEANRQRIEAGPRLDRVPLAFSQLAHWHSYRLWERHGIRQVAFAMRLRGRLNVDALRRSLAEIVRRHDALRTRIVVCDGVPTQEITESGNCELEVDDLTTVSECFHAAEVKRLIEQLILEPIEVTVGPLVGARLIRLREDEHVLVVAMEHMVSDGFSLNILWRDLFTAYMQAVRRVAFSLPAIQMTFADYAVWQMSVQRSWIKENGAYWKERLAKCERLRFPEDRASAKQTKLGWGTVSFRIGRDLKAELREWCRLRRTTVVMSVFTVYVGLVLRWCNGSEAVFQYQSDSRASSKVENTIGFFASMLYLRIKLFEGDDFVDLMNRVVEEYCGAYERADLSWLAAQLPRPEFMRNSVFNWLPQGSKISFSDVGDSDDEITCSPIRFEHPMLRNLDLDGEPSVVLVDADDEILGDVNFPLNRFSVEMMERFVRNFLVFIRALLRQSTKRVMGIPLV